MFVIGNYCCKNLSDIKTMIEKNDKSTKSVLKQILIQLHMTNTSNTKIVNAIKNMDQKVQVTMKSDSRMKSLALPIPTLPTAFINLLPAKSIEEVDLIESILSDDSDGLKHQEELVSSYIESYVFKLCLLYKMYYYLYLKSKVFNKYVPTLIL